MASDNDGTVIPYAVQVSEGIGQLLSWAWSYQQSVRAIGNGLAGVVIISSGNPESTTLRIRARSGSVTGPQIGPMKKSRAGLEAGGPVWAGVSWNPGEVPLTPGEIYYIEATGDPPSTIGLSAHRFTEGENAYPDGHAYRDGTPLTSVDLYMQVVEYSGDVDPPEIERIPASFTSTVVRGNDAPDDTFVVRNSGGGGLAYSISDNVGWLSVNPNSGISGGEADLIDIIYSTSTLAVGSYAGTITIQAPGATNTPQYVVVNLTVDPPLFAPCDFDQDGDVDQGDFGRLQTCYSGPGIAQTDPECQGARLDDDDDVDLNDFGIFQSCTSGPGEPGDPLCAG